MLITLYKVQLYLYKFNGKIKKKNNSYELSKKIPKKQIKFP